jgi:hypothetical protein
MSNNEGPKGPQGPQEETYQYLWQSDSQYATKDASQSAKSTEELKYEEIETARRLDALHNPITEMRLTPIFERETKNKFLEGIPVLYDTYKAALEHDRQLGWGWGEGAASSSKEMFRYAVRYALEAEALRRLEGARRYSGDSLTVPESSKLNDYENKLARDFGPRGMESEHALVEIRKAASIVIGAGINLRKIEDDFDLALAELQ